MRRFRRGWGLAASLALVAGVWVLLVGPVGLGGPAGYIVVSGQSMSPTYADGDLVVTRQSGDYDHGDIAAFRTGSGIVIHRIVGGDADAGYVLRGDNNDTDDPWSPTPDEIIGRAVLHIPSAGSWLAWLREPLPFAVLAGGVGMFLLRPSKTAAERRRHRRSTPRRRARRPAPLKAVRGKPGAIIVAAALGALGVGLAVLVAAAFTSPTTVESFDEHARLEHETTATYTVDVAPSRVYDSTTLGPFGAASTAEPPVIYRELANALDLEIEYTLAADGVEEVTGSYTIDLILRSPDSWEVREPLIDPQPLEGSTFTETVELDIDATAAELDRIAEETGVSANRYEAAIAPTVEVAGTTATDPITGTHAPELVVELDGQVVTPPEQLLASDIDRAGEPLAIANRINIGGVELPVGPVRALSTVALAAVLLALAVIAARQLLGTGRPEPERIRTKYAHMLLSVDAAPNGNAAPHVEVATITDLARIARREQRPILHETTPDGTERFVVFDGDLVYRYAARRE